MHNYPIIPGPISTVYILIIAGDHFIYMVILWGSMGIIYIWLFMGLFIYGVIYMLILYGLLWGCISAAPPVLFYFYYLYLPQTLANGVQYTFCDITGVDGVFLAYICPAPAINKRVYKNLTVVIDGVVIIRIYAIIYIPRPPCHPVCSSRGIITILVPPPSPPHTKIATQKIL